jgi:hypothetical protein
MLKQICRQIHIVLLFCLASPSAASVLSNAANTLAVGSFGEITGSSGFGANLFRTTDGGSVLEFAEEAEWDPVGMKLHFIGSAHGTAYQAKHVRYDEATNVWDILPTPAYFSGSISGLVHQYGHMAMNRSTGKIYMRPYSSRTIYEYTISSQVWGSLSPFPAANRQVAGALENFPERNGLLMVDAWECWFYSFATGQWTSLGQKVMGPYHNFARYNPIRKVILFGGGNGSAQMHKMDINGTITRLTDAPFNLGISASVVTVDPSTGKYLVINRSGASGSQFYEYDVMTDTWTNTGKTLPFSAANDGIIAAPVTNYGVVMFITSNLSNSARFYIYKHGTGGSFTPPPLDTTAPSTPGNLVSSAQSSSQINLSWSTSTDNVGVTGYMLERCQGSGCSSFAQIGTATGNAYSDAGLSASTSYSYRVRANDAAGNLSGYSAVATATTQAASSPPPGVSNFQTRCAQPGVVKCVGFDSTTEITGVWGDPFGSLSGTKTAPAVDTTMKSSGAGSLKFTIPTNSGSDPAGSYFTNFSNNLSIQFGQGQEFYVQWRQRFSPEMLRRFKTTDGQSSGWKQIIVGEGDQPGIKTGSCTELEAVMQQGDAQTATSTNGFPGFYHSCGRFASLQFFDGTQVRWQHQGPPYCYYPNDPLGACFYYAPNEWMTFQMHIQIGKWNTASSRIQIWAARENQASVMIYDSIKSHPSGFTLYNNPGSGSGTKPGAKYGKLWLLSYITRKDPTESHPTAYTWYDELIISTAKLPDPTSSTTPGQAPASPSGLVLK